MSEMRRYRTFDGEYYERVNRTQGTLLDSAWYVKLDAKQEAEKRRKAGNKVRIIESRNVKFFGGDAAFFLYQKINGDE